MASDIFHEILNQVIQDEHHLLVHISALQDAFPNSMLSELKQVAQKLYEANREFDIAMERTAAKWATGRRRQVLIKCPICKKAHCAAAEIYVFSPATPTQKHPPKT